MMRTIFVTVLAALSLSTVTAASAGDLEELDFMTGVWRWDSPTGPIEEWWMPAAGNTKIAAFRWTNGDKIVVAELTIISAEEEGTFLRFKHYDADFTPWEKNEPNIYRLMSAGDSKAEFRRLSENENVPNVLMYARADNMLTFRGTNNPDVASHEDDLVIVFEKAE